MRDFVSRAATWLRQHPSPVGAFVAAGLAVVLYARALTFGFMGDDPSGYFRWMEGASWSGMFTSSPGFFLRPLVFILCKALWLIQGGYHAPSFHAIPLILHVFNTLLLGVLATRLSGRPLLGWMAAMLFAAFPLSHEAVAQIDPLCHPLLTFWALLALVLYERGRRTGKRLYLYMVYPCVALGMLSHENGLTIPLLLLVLELLIYPPKSLRDVLHRPALPTFGIAVIYLFWWAQIPKDPVSATHSLADILLRSPRNTLPFLQAMAYPLMPLARLDVAQWGWLLALAGLTLALTYLAARALDGAQGPARAVRTWLFGVAWIAITSMPSILFLDWEYLHGGARLYYFGSVGAALLWALIPQFIASLGTGPIVRRVAALGATAALMLAMLLPPIPFIGCQMDLYDQATDLVRVVSSQAASAPADRGLVFANLPIFFISNAQHPRGCPPMYPFVTSGVGVFLEYASLSDFIRVNGGPNRAARGIDVAEYAPEWPPRYGDEVPLTGMRDTLLQDQVYAFEIGSWSLRDLASVWQPAAPEVEAPLATFGDALVLEDAAVQQSGSELAVTLQWRVRQVPSQPLTAFAHVYDRDGRLLAQHDGPPGGNGAPTNYVPLSLWQVGDRIVDVHSISFDGQPDPLPTGHKIAVGLYDPATVKRLPARTPKGDPLAGDLYVISQ